MREGLSYDQVCMVPKYNNIPSRNDESMDFGTKISKDCVMNVPILAANMDTVINAELGKELQHFGSIPILHRFHKELSQLMEEVNALTGHCFISCGVNDLATVESVMINATYRPMGVCVDIAHGHSSTVHDALYELKLMRQDWPNMHIIAGNVCTAQAFHDLVNWGADAVKVGIGPGSVCTTREVTPFGVPQFTAIQDCSKISRELQVPMIADGGVRGSREIVLALAAGASSVMIGGLFANTQESACENVFRGQASAHFQDDYYGGVKAGTVAEGRHIEAQLRSLRPSAKEVMESLLGGMRTGFTYCGANSIEELQRKAEFMRHKGD
jgi:IMP dehydrogenase